MAKPITAQELSAVREELDAAGKKLVFTNGCFDILHVGHTRYLQEARDLGDALVVALNDDESVRALKGEARPINTESDRAELLLALSSVDHVVLFSGERCTDAITAARPHIYAKGGDYTPESLNPQEKAALDEAGSEIQILSLVPGKSTSATLKAAGQGENADSRPLKLGVLGSGSGSNFASILDAIDSSQLDAEVVLVISDNEDARILDRARERNISAVYIDPGPYKTRLGEPAQKEICDRLAAAGVELVALAGFMRLVKDPFLGKFEGRILNIHPSLLPKHKGLAAWKQALEAGDSEAGCTVHVVTEEMDAGEILAQGSVPVKDDDTAETLHARIQEVEHVLYPHAIRDYWARIQD